MILFLPQAEWDMVKVYKIMEAVGKENRELLFPKSCGVLWALSETFWEQFKTCKRESYFEYHYLLSLLKSAVTECCGGAPYQQIKKGESRQIPQQQIPKWTLKWRGRNIHAGIFGVVEDSGGIWGGWTAERQDHEGNNISYCHCWRWNGLLVWPRRQFSVLSWK